MEHIERIYNNNILFTYHPFIIVIWWPEGGESYNYSTGYLFYLHVAITRYKECFTLYFLFFLDYFL